MKVDCLKGKEILESKILFSDGIKINNDIKIETKDIPTLTIPNGFIRYTQIGMFIYIIYENIKQHITYMYAIEQKVDKGIMKIENIYTTTIVDNINPLERFFRYDEKFELENLKEKLKLIISNIPVIIEKDFLIKKIEEYLTTEKPIEEDQQISISTTIETPNFHKKITKREKREGKPITCYGKTYNSWHEFFKEYNISQSSGWYMLSRGESPEEIVERYKNKLPNERLKAIRKKGIEYKGIQFPTREQCFKEMHKDIGIGKSTYFRYCKTETSGDKIAEKYLNSKGHDRKKNITYNKKYNYLGEQFTLNELAELSGLGYQTLRSRLDRGWSVEKTVETPVE